MVVNNQTDLILLKSCLSKGLRARRNMWTRYSILVVCLACLGCGASESKSLVRVSGTCRYEDGSFIPGGGLQLTFVSQEAAASGNSEIKPGIASADGDGIFDFVTTHKYADGILPGKHKVYISAEAGSKPRVPKEYLSEQTTPIIIDTASLPLAGWPCQ